MQRTVVQTRWCSLTHLSCAQRPSAQKGRTTFIANDKGHLLPGAAKVRPRPPWNRLLSCWYWMVTQRHCATTEGQRVARLQRNVGFSRPHPDSPHQPHQPLRRGSEAPQVLGTGPAATPHPGGSAHTGSSASNHWLSSRTAGTPCTPSPNWRPLPLWLEAVDPQQQQQQLWVPPLCVSIVQ